MKIHPLPIPLANTGPTERVVKRSALSAFRLLRAAAAQTAKVPAALAQASADVRSAWLESACPKS